MDFQISTPGQIIEKAKEFAGDLFTLNNAEVIQRVIPTDAIFAVLIEAIERAPGESFVATTLTPTLQLGVSLSTSADQGLDGRFFGYLVIMPGKAQIYKHDQFYVEAPASSITVDTNQGEYVLHMPNVQFKLSQILPINTLNGRFLSNASGLQSAVPLLDQLQNQGATVKRISKITSIIGIIIFVIIFFGIIALVTLKK